jgi:ubiquinone/menaquinone biosynthesis C-methylase UbiE
MREAPMPESSVAFVGSIPAAYDRYLGPMLFEPYAADLVARLAAEPVRDVLEIAAGTGMLTARLRGSLPPSAKLTATDLNAPMLEHARTKLRDPAIAWQTADAQALPFANAAFDAVACQFGLMFMPDKALAFREARRVLRDGGRFAFNVWLSLDENPVGRIAHATIAAFFPSNPPTFYEVPFGFHDETRIRELLSAARFDPVRCERVIFEAHSPSARDAARGLVLGNPVLLAIQERAAAPVDAIVDAVAEALAAEGGGAPFRAPMSALVFVCRAAG